MTIDPTLLALIPIVAVLLTIGAGLVGAAIQSRREHDRWVRERRYDAFVSFLSLAYNITQLTLRLKKSQAELSDLDASLASLRAQHGKANDRRSAVRADLDRKEASQTELVSKVDALKEELRGLLTGVIEAATPFSLLGPREAHEVANEFIKSRSVTDDQEAIDRLEVEMRKALRIRY